MQIFLRLRVEPGSEVGFDWYDASEAARSTPGVLNAFPYVEGSILLHNDQDPVRAGVRAIREEDADAVPKLASLVSEGSLNLSDGDLPADCDGRIVLGQELASSLQAYPGDVITAYSVSGMGDMMRAVIDSHEENDQESAELLDELRSVILPFRLEVSGVFEGTVPQYGRIAILPFHIGQEMFETRGAAHALGILTEDPYRAGETKQALLKTLPAGWNPSTWMQRNQAFFDAVRNERYMMFIVLSIIVLVASFSTMNTMITVTVQKKREIGVITAVGAKVSQVVWVFLGQGMVVGVFGSITGVGFGLIFLHFRNHIRQLIAKGTGYEIFDQSVYGLAEIPSVLLWENVFYICGIAFVLCTIASLIPAYMAARTDPARALRND